MIPVLEVGPNGRYRWERFATVDRYGEGEGDFIGVPMADHPAHPMLRLAWLAMQAHAADVAGKPL